MTHFKKTVPLINEEFNKGKFVVQKSTHVFSTMAMNQAQVKTMAAAFEKSGNPFNEDSQ